MEFKKPFNTQSNTVRNLPKPVRQISGPISTQTRKKSSQPSSRKIEQKTQSQSIPWAYQGQFLPYEH